MDPIEVASLLALLPPTMIVRLLLTSGVCSCRSTLGLMSNCRVNSRLSSCRFVDKKVFPHQWCGGQGGGNVRPPQTNKGGLIFCKERWGHPQWDAVSGKDVGLVLKENQCSAIEYTVTHGLLCEITSLEYLFSIVLYIQDPYTRKYLVYCTV